MNSYTSERNPLCNGRRRARHDGLWDWDLISEDVYYSPRWCEIMGNPVDETKRPCRNCWLDKIHPDDYKQVTVEFEDHLQGITEHFQNEHRVLHRRTGNIGGF